MRKLSVKEIKKKLPKFVELVESSYVDTTTKCEFIDKDYGPFTKTPKSVFAGRGHPDRTKKLKQQKSIMTLKECLKKLKETNPGVTMDESTYKSASTPARFIDKEGDSWWQVPSIVFQGHGHTKNKALGNNQADITRILEAMELIRDQGVSIEIDRASYKGMRKHAEFIIEGVSKKYLPSYVVYKYLTSQGIKFGKAPSSSSWAGRGRIKKVEDIKKDLPEGITLVEETYTNATEKCTFIHHESGRFEAVPSQVIRNPKYQKKKQPRVNPRKVTLEEVEYRLPPHIKIVKETFQGIKEKATFIDDEYGTWETLVQSVVRGISSHPDRYKQVMKDKFTLPIEEVKKRLPPYLTLVEETYKTSKTKALFIDEKYGFWEARPNSVFRGTRCPARSTELTKPEQALSEVLQVPKYDQYPTPTLRYRPDFKLTDKLYVNIDGLYWHSEKVKPDINYHFDMRARFEQEGRTLLQFRENELRDNPHTVYSWCDRYLGNTDTIDAGSYNVKSLDKETARDFLAAYSLEAFDEKSSYLGLVNSRGQPFQLLGYIIKDDLCCITHNSTATSLIINKGFQKLLKALEGKYLYTMVIDLRYQDSKDLIEAGFVLSEIKKGYDWTDYKETRTEKISEGWVKIHHAGKAVYQKDMR